MEVDGPVEPMSFPVSTKKFSPNDGETTSADADSRGSQENLNLLQDIRAAQRNPVESWGVDENDASSAKSEFIRESDLSGT